MPHMNGYHFTRVGFQKTSAEFRERHRQQVRDSAGVFRGGWGFAWQGLEDVVNNIYQYAEDVDGDLGAAAQKLADDMVSYAKANAIWQDHPGVHEDARPNLQSAVVKEPDGTWSIYLGHGKNVHYGIWLEVRWGGKFAIILPTIYAFAPTLGDRVRTQT